MNEWAYRFWLEGKGQSSRRTEIRPGDDSRLAA